MVGNPEVMGKILVTAFPATWLPVPQLSGLLNFPGTKRTQVNLFALRKAGLVRAFSTRALQPFLNRGISIHNRDDDCFRFR